MPTEEAYDTLRRLVREMETDPMVTTDVLLAKMRDDDTIDWDTIKAEEKRLNPDVRDWKFYAIKRVCTPGRFTHGGDRTSAAARAAKHHAVVEYVAAQAALPPPTVPEDEVAADCIQKVAQRWRAPTPSGTATLHTVVRTVTRCVRTGVAIDEKASDALVAVTLEEVVTTETETDTQQHSWSEFTRANMHNMDPTVLVALVQLRQTEIQSQTAIKTKKMELSATAELKTTEYELRRREVAVREREVTLLEHQQQREQQPLPASSSTTRRTTKRSAPDPTNDDGWLLAQVERPWRNMTSLTAAVWAQKPANVASVGLESLFQSVVRFVRDQTIAHSPRLFKQRPGVVAVYVRALMPDEMERLVRRFWFWFGRTTTTTTTALAVALDPTEETIDDTPPPSLAPVPIVTTMTVPPPPEEEASLLPTVAPLDNHESRDLVGLVMTGDEDTATRTRWTSLLKRSFVATMQATGWTPWFPMRRNGRDARIPTHLEAVDPIVEALRDWLTSGAADRGEPAPAYPALHPRDPRPPEAVPALLAAMDPDLVWSQLETVGLGRPLHKLRGAYVNGAQLETSPPRAALVPADERLRMWRRVTHAKPKLTYGDIVGVLGWTELVPNDQTLIRRITEVLVRHRTHNPLPIHEWYEITVQEKLWTWAVCLQEMRMAAVLVARLRRGAADLRWLGRDIEAMCNSGNP